MMREVHSFMWLEFGTRKVVNKFLLATDNLGRTVFRLAGQYNTQEHFQRILNWAKLNQTREEVYKYY